MKQPVYFVSLAAGYRLVCFLTFYIAVAGSFGGAGQVRVVPRNSPPAPGESNNPATGLGPPREEPNPEFNLWGGGARLRGAAIWLKVRASKDLEVPATDNRLYPTYDQSDFDRLRDWGANYVSLSCPGLYEVGEPFRPDEKVRAELVTIIAMAKAAHLYVGIGFRTGPLSEESRFSTSKTSKVWDGDDKARVARGKWVEMWGDAASTFGRYDNVVGYELMIEPDAPDPAVWNALAGDIIRRIRLNDKVTPMLVGGAADEGDGSSVAALKGLPLFDDPYTVYAVHQYVPNEFSQQPRFKKKFEKHLSYNCPAPKKGLPKGGEKVIRDYRQPCDEGLSCQKKLENVYTSIDEWRQAHKLPGGGLPTVAVTEAGVVRWAPGAAQFLTDQLRELNNRAFSYVLWRWGPWRCTGDDEFDFRHGQEFSLHEINEGETNYLKAIIATDWGNNKVYAP